MTEEFLHAAVKLLNHMTGGQNLKPCVFMIANEHIPKEGMTVSTTAHMGTADPVHYFTARSRHNDQCGDIRPSDPLYRSRWIRGVYSRRAGETCHDPEKRDPLCGCWDTLRLRRRRERIRVYRNIIKWRKGDFNEQFTESSGGVPLKRHDRL